MSEKLLSGYAWYELWGPIYLIIIAIGIYYYKNRIVDSRLYPVSVKQRRYFLIASAMLYIAKGSPISVLADDFLFSAHVFELSVLYFVVVPLFILSFPKEWLRAYIWHYRLRNALKLVSFPWIAALLFNGGLTAYFLPSFFNVIQRSAVLEVSVQALLLAASFIMWWCIITPLPVPGRFSHFSRMVYVLANAILLMPIAIFMLVVTDAAHYPVYIEAAGMILPDLTAVSDQQLAGGILKALQLGSYGVALFHIISSWGKQEEESEGLIEEENIRIVQGIVIHLPDKTKGRL